MINVLILFLNGLFEPLLNINPSDWENIDKTEDSQIKISQMLLHLEATNQA